ncbi:MAG: helix-turn-helix transcriptional regulator [Spirochaetaceae bacterium]|jgi:transcriptional regulator with XRE-family HTH domain|nr:helix-turn-helix transcriptional regulator [Spirochaetaceae bacterium]
MTSLRALLALNMKNQRRIAGLSQEKLAELVGASTHYIGMIEMERQFPSPEMLERIAAALDIDSPELFSMKTFPKESMKKFQGLVLTDIEHIINSRLNELEKNLPSGA